MDMWRVCVKLYHNNMRMMKKLTCIWIIILLWSSLMILITNPVTAEIGRPPISSEIKTSPVSSFSESLLEEKSPEISVSSGDPEASPESSQNGADLVSYDDTSVSHVDDDTKENTDNPTQPIIEDKQVPQESSPATDESSYSPPSIAPNIETHTIKIKTNDYSSNTPVWAVITEDSTTQSEISSNDPLKTLYTYQTIQIIPSFTTMVYREQAQSTEIQFTVEKNWYTANQINEIRITDPSGQQSFLPTLVGETDEYYTYSINPPAYLGTFSIVGAKIIEIQPYQTNLPDISWTMIISIVIIASALLVIILFKAGYIYRIDEPEKTDNQKALISTENDRSLPQIDTFIWEVTPVKPATYCALYPNQTTDIDTIVFNDHYILFSFQNSPSFPFYFIY